MEGTAQEREALEWEEAMMRGGGESALLQQFASMSASATASASAIASRSGSGSGAIPRKAHK